MSDTLDPRQRRVLRAAERFAAFQEPDSLTDQQCDHALRQEAEAALEELLAAVAAAPCATPATGAAAAPAPTKMPWSTATVTTDARAAMSPRRAAILADRKAGMSCTEVAAKHGVSRMCVVYHCRKALDAGLVTEQEIHWGRGFAGMPAARRREIAARGGRSVRPENRSFSRDRRLARRAARKGGIA